MVAGVDVEFLSKRGGGNVNKARVLRIVSALAAIVMLLTLAMAPGAQAQTDKKKKKNQPPPKVDNSSANPIVPMTDEQQIDYMLSE